MQTSNKGPELHSAETVRTWVQNAQILRLGSPHSLTSRDREFSLDSMNVDVCEELVQWKVDKMLPTEALPGSLEHTVRATNLAL